MTKLNISPIAYKGFQAFIQLSHEERIGLTKAMKNSSSGLVPDRLTTYLSTNTEISEEKVGEIIRMLFSLVGLDESAGYSIKEIISDLYNTLNEMGEKSLVPDDNFQEDLILLLTESSKDKLNLFKKAVTLSHDRANLVHDIKVLTDVRPIFGGKENLEIKSSVVLHNLRLSYRANSNDDDQKSAYFCLDSDDLKKLQDEINRAIRKAEIIKDSLKSEFIEI